MVLAAYFGGVSVADAYADASAADGGVAVGCRFPHTGMNSHRAGYTHRHRGCHDFRARLIALLVLNTSHSCYY